MKLLFFEKAQNLPGRILIELFNSLGEKFTSDTKISFNRVYPLEVVDDKNSRQRIHLQVISPIGQDNEHYMFDMKYGNDFSCANIYLTKCNDNPAIEEKALDWVRANYDFHTGIAGDLTNAFVSGYNLANKK
jgi:hypothetical protein